MRIWYTFKYLQLVYLGFLYIGDLRAGQFRDLPIMSRFEKKPQMPQILIRSVQIVQKSEPCSLRLLLMTSVQLCICAYVFLFHVHHAMLDSTVLLGAFGLNVPGRSTRSSVLWHVPRARVNTVQRSLYTRIPSTCNSFLQSDSSVDFSRAAHTHTNQAPSSSQTLVDRLCDLELVYLFIYLFICLFVYLIVCILCILLYVMCICFCV